MSERQFARRMLRAFTPEVVEKGLQDHIEASKGVYARREEELNAVGLSQKMPLCAEKIPAAMTPVKKRK